MYGFRWNPARPQKKKKKKKKKKNIKKTRCRKVEKVEPRHSSPLVLHGCDIVAVTDPLFSPISNPFVSTILFRGRSVLRVMALALTPTSYV